LRQTFGQAVKWSIISINPVIAAAPPRVEPTKITILDPDEIATVLTTLRGRPLYPVAVLALSTGMRRGELAALRWSDIDLAVGRISVARSLEQTNGGLAFKSPKTRAGVRTISIPASVVAELRQHWRAQQEQRLALGLGKAGGDALVLARYDGAPWPPDSLTTAWQKAVISLKLPRVSLHALRHTHASQLLAAGVGVVTVSRRLGHSNPTVTLNVYAHLFGNPDERASETVERALGGILGS
jgi:integrase